MKINKKQILPVVIVASLVAGVGFASGETQIFHPFASTPPPPPPPAPPVLAAVPPPPPPVLTPKEEILLRIARLKEEIADERQDLKQDQSLLRDHRLEEKDAIKDRIARLRAEIADEGQDLRQMRDRLRREEKSSAEALRDRIRQLSLNLADDRQELSRDKTLLPTLGATAKKKPKQRSPVSRRRLLTSGNGWTASGTVSGKSVWRSGTGSGIKCRG